MKCYQSLYWWDGEYEGYCELAQNHEPTDQHFDGITWFNDDNEEIDPPDTLPA